jgi:anti-sigma regulatory factor (Ser/Thr protein kinase)
MYSSKVDNVWLQGWQMPKQGRTEKIRRYILENVSEHPTDIVSKAVSAFGISRQAAHRHVKKLVSEGLLTASGRTRGRTYELKTLSKAHADLEIASDMSEHRVWAEKVKPALTDLPENVMVICQHGFNEIMNNVIEHSEGTSVRISVESNAVSVGLSVFDNGVGIFNKIKNKLNLEDEQHAILELAKGKLTTDPEKHTGEGIYFTSRVFDIFSILSGRLYFRHSEIGGDWLLEMTDTHTKGTDVAMFISKYSKRTTSKVFDQYSSDEEAYDFSKTHVPVALALYGDENLVSRSQARRLLARFDRFKEVILDFKGVKAIGQAFADEIFRVYKYEHPEVELLWINVNKEVRKMILRAWTATREGEPQPGKLAVAESIMGRKGGGRNK